MNQHAIHVENATIHVHAPGGDAFYHTAGAFLERAILTAEEQQPTKPRYELSSDGAEITDHESGLVWDAEEREFANIDEAEKYVAAMDLGGHAWRTPNVTELQTILDRSRREPACDPIFKSKGGWVLTSTPYKAHKNKPAGSSGLVWFVTFGYGNVISHHRDARCFVRAVRSVAPAGQ